MRWWGSILALLAVCSVGVCGAMVYNSSEESPGTPSLTVYRGEVYIAWARRDYTLKFSRLELKPDGKISFKETESLSDRTTSAFGLSVDDDNLVLAWADEDKNVNLAYYVLEGDGGFKYVDKRGVGKKSSAGASVAVVGDRAYVGYVSDRKDFVTVAVYDLSSSRPKRENIIELTECNTGRPCSIAVVGNALVVSWVNDQNKLVLTTYEIKESSKGTKLTYVKEYMTEERLGIQPAVAPGAGEVLVGFVDKADQYIHMQYFTLESDLSLREGTKLKILEKPATSVVLTVEEDDTIYAGYIDEDGEVTVYKR